MATDRNDSRADRDEDREDRRDEREEAREAREDAQEARRLIDREKFDILRDGPMVLDLGAGQDVVRIQSGPAVAQIRLTIGRGDVGNGNPNEGTAPRQDGGLAVRLQAENSLGALFGPISRFDDEGSTFRTRSNDVNFDVRDLATGA